MNAQTIEVHTTANLVRTAAGLEAHREDCDHTGVLLGVATPPRDGSGMFLTVVSAACLYEAL